MADKDPSEVPPIPIAPIVDLTGNAGEPAEQTVVRPRKKAEPKVVPPAVPPATVAPIEAAPATPAPAPAAAQPDPYAQPNPYTAAPAAPQPNPYATPGAPGAPGGPVNPYGAPQPYAYGPYVPQPPKGLSITSMVLGIAGVLFSFCYGSGFLFGVAAVITGHLAVKRQPYAKAFWLTGIITGYATIGIALLWLAGILLFFFAAGSGSYYSNY